MQTTLDAFYRKRTRLPADSESDFSPKRTARKLFENVESSPSFGGRRTKVLRNYVPSTSKTPSTKSTTSDHLQYSSANVAVSTSSTLESQTDDAQKIVSHTSVTQNSRANENRGKNNPRIDDSTICSSSSTSPKTCRTSPIDVSKLPSTAKTSRTDAQETSRDHVSKCDKTIDDDQTLYPSTTLSPVVSASTVVPPQKNVTAERKEDASPSSSTNRIENTCDEGPSVPVEEPTTPTRSPSTQTRLRKELNLGEHKKIIKRSRLREPFRGKIQKFEETLASLRETQQSLNDLDRSPQLKRFDLMQVEITSPVKRGLLKPRRLFGAGSAYSPTKDNKRSSLIGKSPQKTANERLSYLLDNDREPLALPRKYSILKDTFHWIDTICRCRQGRGQTITFNNIREDVQKASGRLFTENDVAKIKSVYPEAFELSRKKIIVPPSRTANYQLVVTMPEKMDLLAREKAFRNSLLEKTKFHHQNFLKTLDPPLEIPSADVKRWHMDFDLESVPDIEPVPLPATPNVKNVPYTAKELLEKASKTISMSKRMEAALKTMAESNREEDKTESKSKTDEATETIPAEVRAFEKSLKGVSPAILAKIRAKQAAKLAEDVTRSSVEVEETRKLLRLPELAKILRLVFVTRGKCVLPEDMVVETVMKSCKEKISRQNLIEHFQLISKYVPGWMNTFVMHNNRYIRLSKDADVSRVSGKLETIAKSV